MGEPQSPTHQTAIIMNPTYTLRTTLIGSLLFALCGCSALQSGSNEAKSKVVEPAPNAGFIQYPERLKARADMPFQKVWVMPDFDKSRYQYIILAPVDTRHMLEMDWMHSMGSAAWLSDVKSDIAELAAYFHDAVEKELKNDPRHRFQVVDRAPKTGGRTLRLELALIEIDPSEPVLHALGWLQPGAGVAAGVVNQRRAAFEGRLRDVKANRVVAAFADRDTADVGPIDLTRLTWYGPAKGIMDQWAQQFVQLANRKPGEAVNDPTAFTWRPF